ncbi:T9SS type A sorting domain-containing protein [Flavobacterium sp.]|uniref:DUF7619 domain-containing protein n=1 Tax=Flavobacterium sp. TaxID=239 RepID=UPI0037514460
MKNILLLILLFSGVAFGQIPINQPTDLNICSYNSPNSEYIDLSDKKNEIFGSLNQSDYNIFYYTNFIDAQNDENRNIFEAVGTNINLTIYIRVIEISNSTNFEITSLNINLLLVPTTNPVSNLYIENIPYSNVASFNLNFQNSIIIGNQTNTTISYFENLNDANLSQNSINNTSNYVNLTNPQKIYARVNNILSGCYKITTFNLVITNPDIITISDPVFKNLLLHSDPTIQDIAYDNLDNTITIDTNGNGEIEINEVSQVTTIFINNENVQTFEGINSFNNLINFRAFNCYNVHSVNINGLQLLKELYLIEFGLLSNIELYNLPILENLVFAENNITNIDLSNLTSLKYLNCSYNNLSNLNLINLNNLFELNCFSNQIISLNLDNLTNLAELNCGGNNINSLNTINNLNLFNLNCGSNPLLSLILNPNLYNLYCTGTSLVNLDVSYVTNLTFFNCSHNSQLTHLFMKTGESFNPLFQGNLNLTDNYSLEYICADELNIQGIKEFLVMNQNPNVEVNSYCTFEPGGIFNTITGKVSLDSNNNGCDANDLIVSNVKMKLTQWNDISYTITNPNYKFYTTTADQLIEPILENPTYYNVTPQSANISFPETNYLTEIQDFCLTANGIHNDLEIVLMPIGPARSGFDADYKIVFKNKGNQTLSGDVNFTFDDAVLDYVASSIAPNSQVLNNLTWNYSTLLPFETRTILVTLNVNSPLETPAVNLGDVLNFVTTINPVSGDDLPLDNTFTYNQTVVGSFDPNDIMCLEGENVSPSEIGNYLHYAVQFENTGTYQAENVVVKVVIDTNKYDLNSIQLLNTSNPVYTRIIGNKAEFIFETINLAATVGNPPVGGHGDILFKIKSKNNLVNGDFVSKKANIYFDYNAPIETIPFQTTFQALKNSVFIADATITIHPNPTNSIINIISKNTITSIELYDVQGRLLETSIENKSSTTIDISSKQNGIYFLKITSEKGSSVEKIIKE